LASTVVVVYLRIQGHRGLNESNVLWAILPALALTKAEVTARVKSFGYLMGRAHPSASHLLWSQDELDEALYYQTRHDL
jgi:hypothetical protein